MKKFIKNTIIITSIAFVFLSLITNSYYLMNSKQNIKNIGIPQSNETITVTTSIPKDTSVYKLIQLNNYAGRMEVVYNSFKVLFLSIIIGIILSLFTIQKENSKIKFVLIFILGNIIFNIIYTIIEYFIYEIHNLGLEIFNLDIFLYYFENSIYKTFLPYCIIYISLLILQRIYIKRKIDKINNLIK